MPALLAARHDVTALARTPEKAAWLARHGATPVAASLFDRGALIEAFARRDAAVVDDEPLTKRDYADALAAAAGKRAWLRVPGRAANLLGDRSTSLTRSLRVSQARFRASTAWAPRFPSAWEGWKAMRTHDSSA